MTAPVPADVAPVTEPGLGITRRPVPRWVTDPDTRESIALGFIDIDDDFMGEPA
ncbi:hypothetical protein JL475_00110 [Streptomyces sp. M2CJ-2]|uniref:hypothetical protein n=1 Tax=Streptomyces sp. M2CJ-2 TaxID=2803948 RepID=UPI0019208562|nr:hypothetical protein [Streptomyces sp. M2CJ-2]MBL3664448.1 hypothetical protein [Streptomyces sp. M2CJ-2]